MVLILLQVRTITSLLFFQYWCGVEPSSQPRLVEETCRNHYICWACDPPVPTEPMDHGAVCISNECFFSFHLMSGLPDHVCVELLQICNQSRLLWSSALCHDQWHHSKSHTLSQETLAPPPSPDTQVIAQITLWDLLKQFGLCWISASTRFHRSPFINLHLRTFLPVRPPARMFFFSWNELLQTSLLKLSARSLNKTDGSPVQFTAAQIFC